MLQRQMSQNNRWNQMGQQCIPDMEHLDCTPSTTKKMPLAMGVCGNFEDEAGWLVGIFWSHVGRSRRTRRDQVSRVGAYELIKMFMASEWKEGGTPLQREGCGFQVHGLALKQVYHCNSSYLYIPVPSSVLHFGSAHSVPRS